MPTFSRLKTWVSNEVLTAADLNAEFNNLLNNMTPAGIDDASASTSDMQATTDPGGVGTESQATDLLGEIKRLRYKVKQIIGGAQWYSTPAINLSSTIDTADITDLAVSTAKLADGAVTQAKRAALGHQLSASSGNYTASGVGSLTDVTNLSVTITTTGRPVYLALVSDGGGIPSEVGLYNNGATSGTVTYIWFGFKRDAVNVGSFYQYDTIGGTTAKHFISPGAVNHIDIPAAGTYTYTLGAGCGTANLLAYCKYVKLIAYEL